jgi:hypothetical protein
VLVLARPSASATAAVLARRVRVRTVLKDVGTAVDAGALHVRVEQQEARSFTVVGLQMSE